MYRPVFLVLITYLISFNVAVAATDLFTYDRTQQALNEAGSFGARLNANVEDARDVVINLPDRRIKAKKLSPTGAPHEMVTPYTFPEQKGAVFVHTNNGALEKIVIFDQDKEEVFKGTPLANGNILFNPIDIDKYICRDFHLDKGNNTQGTANISYYGNLDSLTLNQVTSLQSRPGASKVIYIDYFAGAVTGTAWNTTPGFETITYANYTYDSDASTFSLIDLKSMYAGWAEAAEDYAPFDVNVTTNRNVYDDADKINTSRMIATSTNWLGAGGVAYVNVFGQRNDDFYSIGWSFNSTFSSMGMTHSHEAGHNMGLSHDGIGSIGYYSGHGNWGPIMGAPFSKTFVHWSNGQYPGANQTENDLSIITGKLGIIADDHGNTNATSTPLNSRELKGFISPSGLSTDIDVFQFTLESPLDVDLTVRSLFQQVTAAATAGGLNLSAKVSLKDSGNTVISQKSPSSNAANNDFVFSGELPADTYYLSIENQSYDTNLATGFNEYGNGGFYQILTSSLRPPSEDDDDLLLMIVPILSAIKAK